MSEGYVIYKCLTCNKVTILLSSEVDHSEKASKYITCGHYGKHKHLIVIGKYGSIKECMQHRSYKRVDGRIKRNDR